MKKRIPFALLLSAAVIFFIFQGFSFQDKKEPWNEKQLIEPAALAQILNDSKAPQPIIYSIGPGGGIKGAVEMGNAKDKENLDKFKTELQKLPKDAPIIIFCGCCPFEKCPNIRPAFNVLNEMKFTNHKLLNLSHNLKIDWINKGYPMQ